MRKVKNFFKRVWSWIKTHWYVIPIFAVFMISLFMLKGTNSDLLRSLLEKYRDQQDRHKREIEELNSINDEAITKQAKIEKTYHDVITEVREKHASDLAVLDKVRQKDLRTIIERNGDDPKKMAREVNMFFGVPVYEGEEDDQ